MPTTFKPLTPWTVVKLREENPDVVFPDVFGLISIEIKENSYPYSQGLRNFDIVISVDGVALTNIYELGIILNNRSIGDVLNLTIIREGVTMNLLYTLKNLEFDHLEYFDDKIKREIESEPEAEIE